MEKVSYVWFKPKGTISHQQKCALCLFFVNPDTALLEWLFITRENMLQFYQKFHDDEAIALLR